MMDEIYVFDVSSNDSVEKEMKKIAVKLNFNNAEQYCKWNPFYNNERDLRTGGFAVEWRIPEAANLEKTGQKSEKYKLFY